MTPVYQITCAQTSLTLTKCRRLTLPCAVCLNGETLTLTLSCADACCAEYTSGGSVLRYDFYADCVKVSFTHTFAAATPIDECRLFIGGIALDGFDRAFTLQPRNNDGRNLDCYAHLPDVSANGYFSPPMLNMLLGTPEGYIGFGLLDLPDSKLVRIEDDLSLLLECPGGNKRTEVYHAPEVLITFPDDEWQAVTLFREKLQEFERYTPDQTAFSELPGWWKDPIICTYGDQIIEDRVGQKIDQAWVEEFVGIAERDWGLAHINLVIDDSWQPSHSFEPVCNEHFPDMRALAKQMHARGHHVILWTTPLFDKITNGFETRAQRMGVLSDYLFNTPYFADFPGCYAIDYTSDNARAFLREVCRVLFGSGEGEWNVDGVKLDFMALLRDPALTTSYAHPERGVGIRELYLFYRMFSEEARRVKPDVIIDCTTGDPRFETFLTHNRLHDTHSGVLEKDLRARLVTLGCPALTVDSDGALMYTHWLRDHYIASAIYGVPACYYLKRFQDFAEWRGVRLFTDNEARAKELTPREKLTYGTLFAMSRLRPDGHPVCDSYGNWRLVDDNGHTTALCIRGDTVIYYPHNDTPGYLFSLRDEAQELPLMGHRFSGLTPAPRYRNLQIDYARDRVLVHPKPGVLYTFRDEDDGTSIDRAFRSGQLAGAEGNMNYVNG